MAEGQWESGNQQQSEIVQYLDLLNFKKSILESRALA